MIGRYTLAKSTKRPDVTWPSPDPTREPNLPNFKVGDRIKVKSDVFFEGLALGGKEGTIKSVKSYILVEFTLYEDETDQYGDRSTVLKQKTVKMLRYEVEHIPQMDLWIGEKI